MESDTVLYTVTGVVENVPDNSHIRFDILASLSTYPQQANNQFWISHNFYTYIVTADGTQKDALQEKLQEMVIKYVGPQLQEAIGQSIDDFRNAGNDFSYVLEPLKDIHLKGATQYNAEPPGSLATVYIFAVIAILILVVAIINYVNLATAKSAGRAKEVGVKKVAGASRTGLIAQFLGESVILAAVAGIIAFLLVIALTPLFNQLMAKPISGLTGVPAYCLSGLIIRLALRPILTGDGAGIIRLRGAKGNTQSRIMSKRLGVSGFFQFAVAICR